jgi:hypothetical protein
MQEIHHEVEARFDRVRDHSSPAVNRRIDLTAQARAELCARQGRNAIVHRLGELDHEWDIDRALMANFALVGGAAYLLGLQRYAERPLLGPRRKGLLYLVGVQMAFLMTHAAIGWCPPVVLLRRLGYRTKSEIEAERVFLQRALEHGNPQAVAA